MHVAELHKPAYHLCPQVGPTGCAVYATRPPVCRVWHCLWQLSDFPEPLRPDRAGIVLDVANLPPQIAAVVPRHAQVVVAMEVVPDAFEWPRAQELLRLLTHREMLVLLKTTTGKRYFLGPQAEIVALQAALQRHPHDAI